MKLTVIGTGYVGLVSGACLADVGNHVWCVDKDVGKVERLKQGIIPIYEPGLDEVVKRNLKEGRLFVTTDLRDAVNKSDICFITVDTPPGDDGKADLTNVIKVAESLGDIISSYKIVVTKSTVPVGTTNRVKEVISSRLRQRGLDPDKLIDVASNPEFLKEGDAVKNFMKPDRVVVGVEKESVGQALHQLYSPFMRKMDRFFQMDIMSSELSKYAANAMLATRISFMNEMARLCDKVGADINLVRNALGSDPRIGADFLYAGLGYGGSCLPKDTKAIINFGREYHENLSIIEAADRTNDIQRKWFWNKVVKYFGGEEKLSGKKIGVWGVAFKPNTDDMRFAPALDIVNSMIACNIFICACDPVAKDNAKKIFGDKISWKENQYDCLDNADALIICTEWHEFRSPDFDQMKKLMKHPVIFDGRNLYDPDVVREKGFDYISVGRDGRHCAK